MKHLMKNFYIVIFSAFLLAISSNGLSTSFKKGGLDPYLLDALRNKTLRLTDTFGNNSTILHIFGSRVYTLQTILYYAKHADPTDQQAIAEDLESALSLKNKNGYTPYDVITKSGRSSIAYKIIRELEEYFNEDESNRDSFHDKATDILENLCNFNTQSTSENTIRHLQTGKSSIGQWLQKKGLVEDIQVPAADRAQNPEISQPMIIGASSSSSFDSTTSSLPGTGTFNTESSLPRAVNTGSTYPRAFNTGSTSLATALSASVALANASSSSSSSSGSAAAFSATASSASAAAPSSRVQAPALSASSNVFGDFESFLSARKTNERARFPLNPNLGDTEYDINSHGLLFNSIRSKMYQATLVLFQNRNKRPYSSMGEKVQQLFERINILIPRLEEKIKSKIIFLEEDSKFDFTINDFKIKNFIKIIDELTLVLQKKIVIGPNRLIRPQDKEIFYSILSSSFAILTLSSSASEEAEQERIATAGLEIIKRRLSKYPDQDMSISINNLLARTQAPATLGSSASSATFGSSASSATFGSSASSATFGSSASSTTHGYSVSSATHGSSASSAIDLSSRQRLIYSLIGESPSSNGPLLIDMVATPTEAQRLQSILHSLETSNAQSKIAQAKAQKLEEEIKALRAAQAQAQAQAAQAQAQAAQAQAKAQKLEEENKALKTEQLSNPFPRVRVYSTAPSKEAVAAAAEAANALAGLSRKRQAPTNESQGAPDQKK